MRGIAIKWDENFPFKLTKICRASPVNQDIVSRVGWFESSIVFQDDAVVMLLYWRKCLLLVGERKFYGHVTAKDSQHVTMKDYTN